jgi:hypothetical protein
VAYFVALAILVCAGDGCGGAAHDLAGKWRMSTDGNEIVWEFFENGTVMQGAIRGRYSFGNNKRLKMETPHATSIYQMEIAGDRLTLTDPHGSKLTFARVNQVGP